MSDNQTAYLDYDLEARRKTFAKKHGAALETRILRFTGQPDEAHLPEIHRLMTNAPRGREYSILNSQFAERATASDLPLTAANGHGIVGFSMETPWIIKDLLCILYD
jgi:hypothetical protein